MWCLSDRLPWRIALVIGLCAALGVETRCASAPTTRETVQAEQDLDDLEDFIDESDAQPEKKATAKKKVAEVKTTVTNQGAAIESMRSEIEDLSGYRWKFFASAAGNILLAFLWLRK